MLPRLSGDPVTVAAPQIDDLAAIAIDGERGADFVTAVQVATEGVGNLAVPLVDVAANKTGWNLDTLRHSQDGSRVAFGRSRNGSNGWR